MKKIVFLLSLWTIATTILTAQDWVARTDFDLSEKWDPNQNKKHSFRMMFDYWSSDSWKNDQYGAWHCVLVGDMIDDKTKLVPGTEKLVKLPVFRDSWICFRSWPTVDFRKIGSGETPISMELFLTPEMMQMVDLAEKNERYFAVISRTREGKKLYEENYRHDMEGFTKWKKQHPHFLAFCVGELCNDYLSLTPKHFKKALDEKKITQSEYDRGIQKYILPKDAAGLTKFMTGIFNSHASFLFADPANMMTMFAYWNLAHFVACNGTGHLLLETTNSTGTSYNTYRWQASMFHTRGAAKQFQIPWSWYIASFYNGFNTQGQFLGDQMFGWTKGRNPWGGMSRSLVKRAHYLSWLSGAWMAYRESASYTLFVADEKGEYNLTPYGEDTVEFYDLTRKHDRGMAYTPIALLTPFEQPQTASGGDAWGRTKEYTSGLYMIDAFMSTILPGYDRPKAIRAGYEGCLYNSKYGDGFDVLNPDAPCPAPLKILPTYKVAILLGEYAENPAMAKSLMEYVQGGGTLVLNVTQLNANYPEDFTGIRQTGNKIESNSYRLEQVIPLTARVVRKDASGNPVFTINKYGKGQVIVTTPEYMTPSPDQPSVAKALGGLDPFEHIHALLDKLTEETYPVKVNGDIQYGINRTEDGYLVYLFNNRGVTKFVDAKASIDPSATAAVTVELRDGNLQSAEEWTSGQKLSCSGNIVNYSVQPGEIALISLKTTAKQ